MADANLADIAIKQTHVSPYHLQDLVDAYSGADNDFYEVTDLTDEKTAVMTEVAAQLAILESAYTIPNAEIVAARDAILAVLNAQITDIYSLNKSTVLATIKSEYEEAIAIANPTPCVKCRVAGVSYGRYFENKDVPGGSDTKKIPCSTCDGLQAVPNQSATTPVTIYPLFDATTRNT